MIQTKVDLFPNNTFGIHAYAERFAVFKTVDELKTLLKDHQATESQITILGGGSNILLTKDQVGLVLKNELKGIKIVDEDDSFAYVCAAGGESWHDFVCFAIENKLGGIENLSLIPGSVGAAPMQNIGAYGVEIKDVFHSLEALNRSELTLQTFTHEDCKFGYRESVFKNELKGQFVITSLTLKLSKVHTLNTSYGAIDTFLADKGIEQPTIKDVSEAVIAIRQSKLPDPKKIGNSGSFFKNPVISSAQFKTLQQKFPTIAHYLNADETVKLAAGWLIETAGWKGKTIGNYGVHKNQALVLVNYGGATGKEIYDLSESILQSVKSMFGIELEREVNIL